jgi:DNA repair photolyase
LRDLDLLTQMASDRLVAVMVSVTTLDPKIARILEPRAAHPRRRVEAIRQLAAAGIPVVASVSPIIPAITDHEIETIVDTVAAAGARDATFIPVRLPYEVAPLFRAWLQEHYPDRAARIMHLIQDIRGGRDNDPNFGTRMKGQGVWADLIKSRFIKARKRAGFTGERLTLRTDLFRPPEGPQLRLL